MTGRTLLKIYIVLASLGIDLWVLQASLLQVQVLLFIVGDL